MASAAPIAEHALALGGPLYRRDVGSALARAEIVLIGEASHGTSEFYLERARLTQRLIEDYGFRAVVVEADWPDAQRVDAFVLGASNDRTAEEALRGFQRFPTWMWRNAEAAGFVEWLREFNNGAPERACGFYGMDLYSLHSSMRAVVSYLESVDANAAAAARDRYACFDQYGPEPQGYGYLATFQFDRGCAAEVLRQFEEMQRVARDAVSASGPAARSAAFAAEQNARLARNAELYYRTMFGGRIDSWNVRDDHMAETLFELAEFLRRENKEPKIVVWAHNSHLGNAAATSMADMGERNVGQLVKQRYGDRALSIGMTTYDGTVMAADTWDGAHSVHRVRPGMPESYEALFHEDGLGANFALDLRDPTPELRARLGKRLERAIGVIYRPQTERQSHYFEADIAEQFDIMLHIDRSMAIEPLDALEAPSFEELPETYPSGE